MYNANHKLRGPNEKIVMSKKMMSEYIRCKEDILYFAENYFHIVDQIKGKHKIKLREYQKRILKAFVETPNNKQHIAMLSSRQIGKTTISLIYLTHFGLFNEDKTVALLANKEKTANEILRRIKLAIEELPLWLQQGVSEANGGWNKGQIGFENGIRMIAGSTASSAIRGESISLLYLDEFAFVPDNIADDFMSSVYPTVSTSPDAKIVVVSTPNGLNHFYHIWRKAIEKDPELQNNFFPIKINWNEIDGRDEEWRKGIIKDIGEQKFAQEYACKFLGSSNTLIDPHILETMEIREPIEMKIGDCLMIYEQPIKGVMYIIGVDSAKGTGKDYSVIQVLKLVSEHQIEQVAVYRSNMINAHDFAQVVISVSDYYNESYMIVENNEVGGTVADVIWNVYECDRILNTDKKGIGTRSTKTTKLDGCILLKKYIDSGWLKIIDRQTIYELSRFEEVRLNIFQAPRGSTDDHVMSLLWALFFVSTPFFDGKDVSVKSIQDKFKLSIENMNDDMPIMFDNTGQNVIGGMEDELEAGWGFEEGLEQSNDDNLGYV